MRKQFEFMDVVNIVSLYISLLNLDENLSQGTAGDMIQSAVNDIHKHLKEQDKKIDYIIERLGKYESNQEISKHD